MELFDRTKINFLPLNSRKSKTSVEEIMVSPDTPAKYSDSRIEKIAKEIIKSRKNNHSVILAFGAHLVKNGLGLILREMIEKGYITHLATNGAGPIHDWEFAFQGKTEEDVREGITQGQFGLWEETGKYLNLALISGAVRGNGYGESICKMIHEDKIIIPGEAFNDKKLKEKLFRQGVKKTGEIPVKHSFKQYSIQDAAFIKQIPFTVHPGFGYDIIYAHPLSDGVSIGKTAENDFLKFANSVSTLEGGVYLSIGSAIMSPMIFEKSLSMARNLSKQKREKIEDFLIVVNDIQDGDWDWNKGEPPKDNPSYYLRFCKTFNRMGAREMNYIKRDNRNFLLQLYHCLK